MKRIMVVASAVLLMGVSSVLGITREHRASGITGAGIKLGLNMSKFNGDDSKLFGVLSPEDRVGLNFGGFMRLGFAPNIGLQLEALYSMKGAKYSAGGESLTFKYDYLEFPVLFLVSPGSGGSVVPDFFLGPAAAIKVSSKASDGTTTVDVTGIKSTDLGIVVGGGVTARMGTGSMLFDIRYTMGLTKWDDSSVPADMKNGVWSLNVGFSFR